ncbi:MAG: hypothetical protein IPK27_17925 [Rhodanobacteraceae bacterium]|nr:hypothetical protein [Rhodanobacteraceae bacterium]
MSIETRLHPLTSRRSRRRPSCSAAAPTEIELRALVEAAVRVSDHEIATVAAAHDGALPVRPRKPLVALRGARAANSTDPPAPRT